MKIILIALALKLLIPLPYIFPQKMDLEFEHLTADDGLSQGSINCITQDSKGFMWFGTNDGLNKYDGYDFTVYKHISGDTTSISNNWILSIFEDSKGFLWVGTNGGGINRYNRKTNGFTTFQHDPNNTNSLSNNNVTSICEDDDGSLWFGTREGLNQHNPNSNSFIHFFSNLEKPNSLSINYISALHFSETTKLLYVGTNLGGLNVLNPQNGEITNFLWDKYSTDKTNGAIVKSIAEDKNSDLWIATFCDGVYKINFNRKEEKQFLFEKTKTEELSDCVKSLSIDDEGFLWIGSDSDYLTNFNLNTEEMNSLDYQQINQDKTGGIGILSLYFDKSGILWIGSNGYGISYTYLKSKKFKNLAHQQNNTNSLGFNSVRSIFQDDKDILYVGGYSGLDEINRRTGNVNHYFEGIAVYSISEDPKDSNILWIGSDGRGFYKFDKSTHLIYQYTENYHPNENVITGEFVFEIFPENKQTLWIGTNRGLNKFDTKQQKFTFFGHNPDDSNSLTKGQVRSIYEDKNRKLWIGTHIGGISIFDKITQNFTHIKHNPNDSTSLSSNTVLSFYEDSKNRIWIGTTNGLNKFNPIDTTFTHYSELNGLPNNVIYGILEDAEGFLWLSTNKGLAKFNPETKISKNYDVDDGLQGNEFNSAAFYKNKHGEMFFGGVNGLTYFDPAKVTDNRYKPLVVLTSFKKFNKEVETNPHISELTELELLYDDLVVSFEFAALNYYKSHKNQYSYMLEGLHDDWIELGTKRDITFTSLDDEEYTLKIIASNNDGIWNKEGLSLSLIIHPPFWKTWWAYSSYVFIILFSIIFYVKWKTYKTIKEKKHLEKVVAERTTELRKLNADKDRFFSIVAHDMKTPLIAIMNFSKVLKKQFTKLSEADKIAAINEINETVNYNYKFLNNLLDWSRIQINRFDFKPENIDIKKLIDSNIGVLSTSAKNKEIDLISNVENSVYVFADYEMVSIVIRNLISNSIKFTQRNGRIDVDSKISNRFVEISVSDNGIGMDEKTMTKLFKVDNTIKNKGTENEKGTGLGLILSKELILKNGGDIFVESKIENLHTRLAESKQAGKAGGSRFWFTLPIKENL